MLHSFNKLKLTNIATFFAAIAAIASAYTAFLSYDYLKETNIGTISLTNADVLIETNNIDLPEFVFRFRFENIGKESISSIRLYPALFAFKSNTFIELKAIKPINTLPPGSSSIYSFESTFRIDPKSNLSEIKNAFIAKHKKMSVILLITFKSNSETYNITYYYRFVGDDKMYVLDENEYISMEPFLLDKFKYR